MPQPEEVTLPDPPTATLSHALSAPGLTQIGLSTEQLVRFHFASLVLRTRDEDTPTEMLVSLAAALASFVLDTPGLTPAGPLLLVPTGAKVSFSMANEIPQKMEGIQTFRPENYDGPISAEVTAGNGGVAPEGDSGDVFRVSPADDAAEGETITVKYSADRRHGTGQEWTEDDVTYTIVAADADPLTEEGFDVVAKGAPVPVPVA